MENRRNIFYQLLKIKLKTIEFPDYTIKTRVTKGNLDIWCIDNMHVVINITDFVTHHKKGEFAVNFGLSLYSGTIYEILQQSTLLVEHPIFRRERFYVNTHYHLVSNSELDDGLYNFYLETDIDKQTEKIVSHIKKYALPIIYGFQKDYNYLLDRFDSSTGIYRNVCNPFYIGVILCILNKMEERIDEIINYARGAHAISYTDFSEENYKIGINKIKQVMQTQ